MIRLFPHVLAVVPAFAPGVAQPIFVEDRAEIPWIVVSTPGATCGSFKITGGPKQSRDALIAGVSQQKERKSEPNAVVVDVIIVAVVELLPTPGLWGLEGEVVVAAAEVLMRRIGVDGPVSLRLGSRGAWLDLPARPTEAALAAGFSGPELKGIVAMASSRLARRHADVGALAAEQAQRFSCHGVGDDPALPADLGRRLRARFG